MINVLIFYKLYYTVSTTFLIIGITSCSHCVYCTVVYKTILYIPLCINILELDFHSLLLSCNLLFSITFVCLMNS